MTTSGCGGAIALPTWFRALLGGAVKVSSYAYLTGMRHDVESNAAATCIDLWTDDVKRVTFTTLRVTPSRMSSHGGRSLLIN